MVQGFKRLRHHAIIGGDNQHYDVCDLGSTGAHAGKGFVAGSIEEDNLAAKGRRIFLGDLHLVSADMLCDSSRLTSGDIGFTNSIKQRSLAMIYVTHDGHHWRTRHR